MQNRHLIAQGVHMMHEHECTPTVCWCTCVAGSTKPRFVESPEGRSSTEMGMIRCFLSLWSVLLLATSGENALDKEQ